MRQRSTRISGWSPLSGSMLTLILCLGSAAGLPAQSVSYTVDPQTSLAWWQINPHLNHLWATTCPGDPSWRAGEGVSVANARSFITLVHKRRGYSAMLDTIVPLYPRRAVRPVCTPAVSGRIEVQNTSEWSGVRGLVRVQADALVTGLRMRDDFASKAVLQSGRYPEIRFQIDSLVAVQPGDTLRAEAVGVFHLHGVAEPMRIPVKAWREADGWRVTGRADIPASDLIEKYGMSKWALGLGVTTAIWKILHMGIDVLLQEAS